MKERRKTTLPLKAGKISPRTLREFHALLLRTDKASIEVGRSIYIIRERVEISRT